MEAIGKKLTEQEIFDLQKEFIKIYAEGYYDGNGDKKQLKDTLLKSNFLKDFNNDDLVNWLKTK